MINLASITTFCIIVLPLVLSILAVTFLLVREVSYTLFPERMATRALAACDYSGRVVAVNADKDTVMLVLEIHKTKLQYIRRPF